MLRKQKWQFCKNDNETITTFNEKTQKEVTLHSTKYTMYTGGRFGRSDGIVAVTWCVAAFFFVNIYSSCLTSGPQYTFLLTLLFHRSLTL